MKKKAIISIILSLVAMVIVPVFTVLFLLGNDAMGVMLIFTFALNPIVSVIIGILSGIGGKIQWYLPVINSVIYLIAAIAIMTFDITFVIAAVIYLALAFVAALIAAKVGQKKG